MRILLVDDHTLVRIGLARLLTLCMQDVQVAEAGDAEGAEVLLGEQAFDVALLDIRLPGRSGLDLLRDIRRDFPDVPVIIVTNYDNPEYVKAALAEGAAGYLLKDSTITDLSQAIAAAISGAGAVISGRAIRGLFEGNGAVRGRSEANGHRLIEGVTHREAEVLEQVAKGHSNREISRKLYLSEKTVKGRLGTAFRKLGVTNRTQAAMAAVSMGIGEVPGLHRPLASVRGAA